VENKRRKDKLLMQIYNRGDKEIIKLARII
jgi:hypothetical protein